MRKYLRPVFLGLIISVLAIAHAWGQMNNIATITGEGGGSFGQSVSSADVNGDGYPDVIAYGYSGKGRVYIYLSGSGLNSNTPDYIITEENNSDYFGASVSSAGDVDNDNKDDIIVGAWGYPSYSLQGRAYIFLGANLATKSASGADYIITGENNSDRFGESVSSAGDVDGDNKDDIIVGAIYYPSNSRQGRAYLFLGSNLATESASGADYIITGENNNDYFGYSVSSAGDVNGDDKSDVAVGAYGANKAYVYSLLNQQSLAVELSSFTATTSGDRVIISWRTESETDNVGFTIYRGESKDGKFIEIAFVKSKGTTGMPTDYQFIDQKVKAGQTYFYYIEDVDLFGEKSKSEMLKAIVPAKSAMSLPSNFALLQNYPKPLQS